MAKEEVNKAIIATHSDDSRENSAIVADDLKVTVDKPEEDPHTRYIYQEYRNRAIKLYNTAYESRKRYDWDWLTRDLYRRGYQFSRYNPSNRTVIISARSTIKVPINLLWAQMRTIKNQVVSFRPKWDVVPKGISEEAVNNARYSGKLLDYFYEKFNLRKLIKETVIQGLIISVGGPWQVGFDPDADDGKGEIFIWLLDPFDFYLDPSATSLEDAEFVVKAIRRPLDEIKKNPNYNFYVMPEHGEERRAASEYKQFLLQALKYQTDYTETQEGAILKECWMKVRVGPDNIDKLKKECWMKVRVGPDNIDKLKKELKDSDQDNDNLRMGEILLRVVTYLDFLMDPLRVQLLRRNHYPFIMYQADINPREIYGESWAKHVIPMNRVLNALESSVYQYNYKYGKGRIVIDKNSGVRVISNEHGDIIEKNQGAEVTSLPLQPLPASYSIQIENMRRYIEDIGGAHDVSLGRIPAGIKSGVGIAELKQADATNQTDLVDNLEDFLVQVGEKALYEVSHNYDVPKLIEVLGKKGKPEHFAVIGEDYLANRSDTKKVKIGADVFDIASIGARNQISVRIGSWLAYTKEAQYEKLKEFYQAGLIDQQTFLEHAEFSDVDGIIEKTRHEAVLKKYRGNPAQGETQASDEEIADQENIMMVNEGRQDVKPLDTDNHSVHLIIHQDFADNPLVDIHMKEHENMAKNPQPLPQPGQPPMMGQNPMMGQATPPPAGVPPVSSPQPPVNPDEQALMQSLQGVMGGQNEQV